MRDAHEVAGTDGIEMAVTHQEPGRKTPQMAYTSFSRPQLRQLQLLLGLSTITSPLTATIYFPLLPHLRQHFNTSAQAINLTLTIYIIFQAISPVIFGPLSDSYGRRPFFLLTLALYIIGNIGLAANKANYAVLLVLRAVQSLGASAAYSISFGVVADVCVSSERGRMLGPISMALNLGACVGPVVGGAVAYTSGSHVWVFWALVIVGFVLLFAVGMLLPETARNQVGNGSDLRSYKWWQLSWAMVLKRSLQGRPSPDLDVCGTDTGHPNGEDGPVDSTSSPAGGGKAAFTGIVTGIWACFRLIFYKDTSLTLWVHGCFYTVDYSFVAAVPDIFKDVYHFNELQVGLAYLPRGVGIIAGSYFTGKQMDHNYRKTAEKHKRDDKVKWDDMWQFPIEEARTRYSSWLLFLSVGGTVGYGWAVGRGAHVSVILILQFMQGFWGTFFYTTYSALLVDSFPQSASTAAATTSITRCAMAAAGVAILQPLLDIAGRMWYFTVLGLWSGVSCGAAIFLLRWRGIVWRQRRKEE